ncbi:MAG: adenylyl-sulfate kinase [Dehalococcoidia bacterium]|nr:adenylyl-sulfate kinase [Dehalococcoidia bacterium]
MAKQGFVIWFTGLSGAGKSTLAEMLEKNLKQRGDAATILDGDVVRQYFSKGLGFSREDRIENLRRIAFVAKLLADNGVVTITAAISPFQEARDFARGHIGRFVEIYAKTSLDAVIKRDVKGLYKKAIAGEIKNFTGISDPFDEPTHSDIVVETDKQTVDESFQQIMNTLIAKGLLEQEASIPVSLPASLVHKVAGGANPSDAIQKILASHAAK